MVDGRGGNVKGIAIDSCLPSGRRRGCPSNRPKFRLASQGLLRRVTFCRQKVTKDRQRRGLTLVAAVSSGRGIGFQ